MCGPGIPRASKGGRIAVLFPPSPSTTTPSSSSLFLYHTPSNRTRAVLSIDDENTSGFITGCRSIGLRFERYGVLANPTDAIPPMHSFNLDLKKTDPSAMLEFDLPPLDLGVSDSGVVGRQVTMLGEGRALGMGIVGYN